VKPPPPLTDKEAWAQFPAEDYDVLIVDSLGAFTEGVSEKEGKQTQEFLATLKNLATRGLAILVLTNTNKAGISIRGRGEQSDAVDIVYEARNMTGWEPTGGPQWWESLPDAGEQAWQQNTTRRVHGGALRIGFVPTKFRLGMLPQPFVLEMDTTSTPWTMRDITTQITQEGIQAEQERRSAERAKLDAAAEALVEALRGRDSANPMLKREAEDFLQASGLKQKQARNALAFGYNKLVHPAEGLWELHEIPGRRGSAIGVYRPGQFFSTTAGEEMHNQNKHNTKSAMSDAGENFSISVDGFPGGNQNTASVSCNDSADSRGADFGRSLDTQRPKSTGLSGAKTLEENDTPLFRSNSHYPTEPCLHEHVNDYGSCNDCGLVLHERT